MDTGGLEPHGSGDITRTIFLLFPLEQYNSYANYLVDNYSNYTPKGYN